MSFNQVENLFLSTAIEDLWPQMRRHQEYRHHFYGGKLPYLGDGVTYMVLDDGRLTVAKADGSGSCVPDPNIVPVDCYNRIREGEDMATAVRRVFG